MNETDRKISEIAKSALQKKEFIPEKSKVPISGKVFDEKELINGIKSILDCWWTEGDYTEKFKLKLSSFLSIQYIIPVNSGSSANLLAFSALTSHMVKERRIMPGEEVICVAASFPTTINPVIQHGCIPVFLDVDIGGYNIKTQNLEKAISKKTKAVFIAHTLGNPFDLKKVKDMCKKHNLWLIEDCCDALGSKYDNKLVGTFGDMATFSFYPAHQITAGEGGAVVTDSPILKRALESIRDWGRDCWCPTGKENTCGLRFSHKLGELPFGYDHKYTYSNLGYNLKWTDMQAAIACAQMEKLPAFIEKRKLNFIRLKKGLSNFKCLIMPEATENSDPCWFGFPISIKEGSGFTRNELIDYLEKNNIATRLLFGGNITRQPYFKELKYRVAEPLTTTDFVMNNTFWIGVYPGITDEMIDYILKKFNEFFSRY